MRTKPLSKTSTHFSEWLNKQLAKNKWSMNKLSKESKLSMNSVWNISKGRISPTLDTVEAICTALKSIPESALRMRK